MFTGGAHRNSRLRRATPPTPAGQRQPSNDGQAAPHDPASIVGHEALRGERCIEALQQPHGARRRNQQPYDYAGDSHRAIVRESCGCGHLPLTSTRRIPRCRQTA